MKRLIKIFAAWVLRDEIDTLTNEINDLAKNVNELKKIYNGLDAGVDIHHSESSWAVIKLKGKEKDLVKFIDLGDTDLKLIASFLANFDRPSIDASPMDRRFLMDKWI